MCSQHYPNHIFLFLFLLYLNKGINLLLFSIQLFEHINEQFQITNYIFLYNKLVVYSFSYSFSSHIWIYILYNGPWQEVSVAEGLCQGGGIPCLYPEDMIFLFEEVTCAESVVLNHADPTECYVLFPPLVQLDEIYNLNKDPSWVGGPMALSIRQPPSGAMNIVKKLVENKTSGRGGEV